MKQFYVNTRFYAATRGMIDQINEIVDDYAAQGFRLTVRQVYYQLVSTDVIPNDVRAYQRLVQTITDGRLAGLIDWDAIEDRNREFSSLARWTSAKHITECSVRDFHMDMWKGQDYRVVVMIEKAALAGVFERPCNEFDVPMLPTRGYASISVLREFAEQQIIRHADQKTVILHFGDHDPSGIDMTRDILDRLKIFTKPEGVEFELHRIALNMDQVRKQNPPPNPAKESDSRFRDYKKKFGTSSWELDALKPEFLMNLVQKNVREYIAEDTWAARLREIERERKKLDWAVDNINKPHKPTKKKQKPKPKPKVKAKPRKTARRLPKRRGRK